MLKESFPFHLQNSILFNSHVEILSKKFFPFGIIRNILPGVQKNQNLLTTGVAAIGKAVGNGRQDTKFAPPDVGGAGLGG